MIETVSHCNRIMAILVRNSYHNTGITFFTPDEFSQQLAYINHPAGHVIAPHVHNPVHREVFYTEEVLVIKSGKLRVDFYHDDHSYIESRILDQGDVILLAAGGHGFEMLEASEVIEIKQGPYAGEADKTRFQPVEPEKLKVLE